MRHHAHALGITAAVTAALIAQGTIAAPPAEGLQRRQAIVEQLELELGLTGEIVDLALDDAPVSRLVTEVMIDGQARTLDLKTHSMRAPGYRLLVQVEGGALVEHDPGPVRTMRGTVVGQPGSVVAASLGDDGLHAMIDLAGDGSAGRHWIVPVTELADAGVAGEHLLYHDSGVVCPEGSCGVEAHNHAANTNDLTDRARGAKPQDDAPATEAAEDGGVAGTEGCLWIAEIAFDADWEYFDGPGGNNVTFTESRIMTVINSVAVQYLNEVDIDYNVTTIIVRSSVDDPYSDTLAAGSLLAEFTNHWNTFQSGIQRDLAELFTGRNFSGTTIGIASLSAVCTNQGYSTVQDELFFSCRTDLTAHELGHNWSAQHCSCPGFTMNPSLTCANQFTTASENSIIAHRNSRPCLDVFCPPDNDDCADAITIGTGNTPFSTIFSSLDGPGETLCPEGNIASDIWFTYTAPCTGDITFSLCDADYDTSMAIYDGHGCPTGGNTAIACNDDFCGTQSSITISAVEDDDLLIRIGGNFASQGTGSLEITTAPDCIAIPGNDVCSSATSLSPGVNFFVTSGAASEGPDEPGVCDFAGSTQIDKDIWYRHIAQCDGELTVSLCSSGYDTKLAVYGSSCPGGDGEALACNDDSCGLQSELTIPVNQGSIYRIRVGGFNGASGFGQIELTCNEVSNCPGDSNDDGMVNVDDLNNVILDWGTDGSANGGDLTDASGTGPPDGLVDVNDLNAVIVNWGACP